MSGWMIVVDRLADLPAAVAGYPAMTARDYIMQPRATRRAVPKILNLSRSYGYQTLGYYCSLLAEARGHKVVPTVATVLELARRASYVYALSELEDNLNRTIRRLADPPTASFRLLVCLGQADDPRFNRFGRQLFDWFRCPILEVFVKAGESWRVRKLAPVSIAELGETGKARLKAMLDTHDGFEIARRDLEIRGPGEFMGARQSGDALLRFADLQEDSQLLQQARRIAPLLLAQHPQAAQRHVQRWLGAGIDFLKA